MQRRTSYALVALASSAALVAGCGSSSGGSTGGTGSNDPSQTPTAELTNAFSALGHSSTLTAAIKLGASASDIKSLASSNGSTLTDQQAGAIAGAQISVEVQATSGKTLSDLTGSSTGEKTDITISDNGTNFLSARVVNQDLFLQVDLKDLLTAIGKGSTLTQLQSLTANPQVPAFVKALVAGNWVSLPESTLTGLTGSSAGSSSANPQQAQAIINGIKQILASDVTAVRTSTGTTDVLKLTANSRKVVTDFLNTVTTAVPTAALALGQVDPSQVPSKNIVLGANVTGGALSQLSIDVGQFAPANEPQSLPIEVNFAQSGPAIAAPSGATAISSQDLQSLLGSLGSGLTG